MKSIKLWNDISDISYVGEMEVIEDLPEELTFKLVTEGVINSNLVK